MEKNLFQPRRLEPRLKEVEELFMKLLKEIKLKYPKGSFTHDGDYNLKIISSGITNGGFVKSDKYFGYVRIEYPDGSKGYRTLNDKLELDRCMSPHAAYQKIKLIGKKIVGLEN